MACSGNKILTSQQMQNSQASLPVINGRCLVCKEVDGHLPGCIVQRSPIVAVHKKPKPGFQEVRLGICGNCEHAEQDTCKIVEAKYPGRSSISHGVVRPGLRCPLLEPRWIEHPVTCSSCGRPKQRINDRIGVCQWCELERSVANQKNTMIPKRSVIAAVGTTRGFRGSGSSFRETGEPQWVSMQQLSYDVKILASIVPSDVRVIVGVARSGITPASILASLLHLPMLSIRQTKNDIVEVGNGWRLGGNQHINPAGRALIVDDTVMTGNSLKAIANLVADRLPNSLTAAIYVNPLAKRKPDIWVRDLGWPHLLEWNIFNSVLSPNMAMDFDGILCLDCPPGADDDGPKYLDFIRDAKPLYMPRKVPIPMIVTARIEKYRKHTLDWLKRHGLFTYNLVMHPAKTLRERQQDDIPSYKARHYLNWSRHHIPHPAPLGFIESEDWQARKIAAITGLMTICPATSGVYPSGLNYTEIDDIKPSIKKNGPS